MDSPENAAALLFALQSELQHQRVLLIDRHPPAREALRLMLANLGITLVHGAGSSAEVIRQVKGNRFDIVLSDYILDDGRDGQQLLEELRHNHLLPLASVYMIVTSERSYHNVVSLAELTPDDYLIKPFTADMLQNRLARALLKKHVLKPVHSRMERGAYVEALESCTTVGRENPAYLPETLRLKGELLQTLGRLDEAELLYREILLTKSVPWAKMGLALVARRKENLDEAAELALELVAENPDFLAAYDLLAEVRETQGYLTTAQETLQEAALRSPHNTLRQRLVGDIALKNNDLEVAEKAFGRVLERHRSSTLRSVDDYTNLSKVHVEKGNLSGAREIAKSLRRDWRGEKQGELAALVVEGLTYQKEGNQEQAQETISQALALHREMAAEPMAGGSSQRLAVDLAHACMAGGMDEEAHQILRQVASENHDDQRVIAHIERVFEKAGQANVGKAMLESVSAEIISLNNRGVRAARGGDLKGAVQMLIEAADRVPNVQFLVNAARAIFTLMDAQGWDQELAARGMDYLRRAQTKAPYNPKVFQAKEICHQVARKYGVSSFDKEAS